MHYNMQNNIEGFTQGSDDPTEPRRYTQQDGTLNPYGLSHTYRPPSPQQRRPRVKSRRFLVIGLLLLVIPVVLGEFLVFYKFDLSSIIK